ncbi:MAG: DUF4919 domain-containing protein [Verrucomicrobiales bacterium]|nr:DUF4919 domain-containing protein [Verrucomicrobiales bacterium]
MKELFSAYLKNPTLDNFRSLRTAFISDKQFDPYSDELDGVGRLVHEARYEEAVNLIRKHLLPGYLLSPSAHMNLSIALGKLGKDDDAKVEKKIAGLLLSGIEMTGDGTPQAPFQVTRISDEYDYLAAYQLGFRQQSLEELNQRRLDRLELDNGKAVYFDVTDLAR